MANTKGPRQALSVTHPELVLEWDWEKNAPLTPDDVTYGTHNKVWWIGKCGHSWDEKVEKRTLRSFGCPYCSGKRVLVGFNDLATKNSDLAKEWNFEKNAPLTPYDVTLHSGKKVWWIGKCGHEWEAAVDDRVRGHGCHICTSRKVLVGVNDLASQNPELAKEWHPSKNGSLLPTQVTSGANQKVWWKCSKCGNEWQATVATRKKGVGCSVCSGEKQTSFPEQALFFYLSQRFESISRYNDGQYELDVFLPKYKIGIEYDGIYYHNNEKSKGRELRKESHFQKQGIRLIRIKESTENTRVNDIVFFNVDPLYKLLPWAIQHVFHIIDCSVEIPDIDLCRDQGKIHEQYILKEKENSLLVVHPELESEWDYEKNLIDPSKISFSSGKKVWWKCSVCKNEWFASIAHRAAGRGCPSCSKKKQAKSKITTLLQSQDSLQDAFPKIATEWHPTLNEGLKPTEVLPRSKRKVWWKCSKCGNEWPAAIYSRVEGNGCPECGRKKSASSRKKTILSKKGSLLDNHPELAKEWHPVKNNGLLPSDVTSGSNIKVWWIGKCGHEWEASVKDRVHGHGCHKCAYRIRVEKRKKDRDNNS